MTTVILDDDVAVVKSTPTEVTVEEQINTQVVTTVEDEFSVVTVSDVSIVKSIDPTSSVVATGLQGQLFGGGGGAGRVIITAW